MIPYFLLLLCVSVPAALESSRKKKLTGKTFFWFSLLLIIFIGFRFQTGGDWLNYSDALMKAYGVPFWEFFSIQRYEPLYAFLNWFGANQFGVR